VNAGDYVCRNFTQETSEECSDKLAENLADKPGPIATSLSGL